MKYYYNFKVNCNYEGYDENNRYHIIDQFIALDGLGYSIVDTTLPFTVEDGYLHSYYFELDNAIEIVNYLNRR